MLNLNRDRLKKWLFNPDKHHYSGIYGLIDWWVIRFEDIYGHWAVVRFKDNIGGMKFDDRLFIVREIDHLKPSVENYLHDELSRFER